jgi:hypothetical protein
VTHIRFYLVDNIINKNRWHNLPDIERAYSPIASPFDRNHLLGTVIRDTQIRATKNAKEHTNYNHQSLGHKFRLARPLRASGISSDSPDPQGLGRKFRLARPPRASDASSDSPNPSGSRTQVPSRPTPSRLGRRTPLHLGSKTSTTRRPYPRRDRRDDSHTAAGQGVDCSNHPGHCSLTSFAV